MTVKLVDIRPAQASLEVQVGQTILDAALAAGIPYPHGCKSGRCGACKSRLIEGEVKLFQHSPFALTDVEKADGLILACRALPLTATAVAWIGSNDGGTVLPPRRLEGIVTHIDDLTHDIKLVQIMTQDRCRLLFAAGQFANVSFDGVPPRSYSMANQPGAAGLEFHIRRVPGGVTSQHVHSRLKSGDKATLEFPLGSSYLRQHHSGPILCVAGGSGLAPIKAIVETALSHGTKHPIHIYFGARGERDLYLVEHFQALARRHPNLSFTPVLSEAQTTQYRTGFVTQVVGKDLSDLGGWKAYVAGPPLMVDAAIEASFARGLRQEDMHADVFFTPEAKPTPGAIG
ncbi:oxidoreductase [Ensifer sp. Root31]|uniref:2Fe-2S iron-sulfur cluster-binding protein n=1 Tax=Ensifer sp. Root31 TaxID=1736512 RepID=UPI00070C5E00|nr:2Fe-2S iron-sulfur cluster-binding protein [Ensifer sp. Root31]KQU78973.1 oxidoreductase [Ensifer sp. Root31]